MEYFLALVVHMKALDGSCFISYSRVFPTFYFWGSNTNAQPVTQLLQISNFVAMFEGKLQRVNVL